MAKLDNQHPLLHFIPNFPGFREVPHSTLQTPQWRSNLRWLSKGRDTQPPLLLLYTPKLWMWETSPQRYPAARVLVSERTEDTTVLGHHPPSQWSTCLQPRCPWLEVSFLNFPASTIQAELPAPYPPLLFQACPFSLRGADHTHLTPHTERGGPYAHTPHSHPRSPPQVPTWAWIAASGKELPQPPTRVLACPQHACSTHRQAPSPKAVTLWRGEEQEEEGLLLKKINF